MQGALVRGAHLAGFLVAAVALDRVSRAIHLRQAPLLPAPAGLAGLGAAARQVPLPIRLGYAGCGRRLGGPGTMVLRLLLSLLPLLKVFHGLQEHSVLLVLLVPLVLRLLRPLRLLLRHATLAPKPPRQVFNVPSKTSRTGLPGVGRLDAVRCG